MWLSSFFDKASLLQKYPVIIFINNNKLINIIKTYWKYKRMKYIDVYYYFVKEKVKTEKFKPVYIPSNNNIADLFTKTLLVTILRPKS